MKKKWQQLLTTSLILSCLVSTSLFTREVLAEETEKSSETVSTLTSETVEETEESQLEATMISTTPIDLAKTFSAGITPNQMFEGNVGDHPLLESFGDVEGEGLLAGVTRDTGSHKVIPFVSKRTPGRQMAMKLGNEAFGTRRLYPADTDKVSSLVYEGEVVGEYGERLNWPGTLLDSATVGILSPDGKKFTDIRTSDLNPYSTSKESQRGTRVNEYMRTKGMLIAQTDDPEADRYGIENGTRLTWVVPKPPHGQANGNTTGNGVALMRMYNNEDSEDPYIVAYGAHLQKLNRPGTLGGWKGPLDLLGYVRVIMQPVGDEGRVRITYSYINLTSEEKRQTSAFYYNFSMQLDETRSRGNEIGEFFSTPRIAADGVGYGYTMYRDEYPEVTREGQPPLSSPTNRVVAESTIPQKLFSPGITPADPGENQLFDSRALTYVGEKQPTDFKEVASWDLDVQGFNMYTLTVNHVFKDRPGSNFAPREVSNWLNGDKYTAKPIEHKVYRAAKPYDDNYTGTFDDKNIEVTFEYELIPTKGDVLTHYQDVTGKEIKTTDKYTGEIGGANYLVKPQEIDGYVYVKTDGTEDVNVDVVIKEETQEVTFVYLKLDEVFQLKQKVTNDLDESVDQGTARQGETLTYHAELEAAKEVQERPYGYQSAVFTIDVDPSLEKIEEIELKDSQGKSVGDGTYTAETNKLKVNLTDLTVLTESDLVLTYQATVKMSAKIAENINQKTQTNVAIKFSELTSKDIKTESNEVVTAIESGQLELVSAPLEVDFGEVKVIDFQQKVGTDKSNVSHPLSVIDKRVTPQKWDIVAEVIKHMTNGDHELTNALKYRYNGKTLTLGSDIKTIYESEGTATGHEVNITDTWGTAAIEDGLKVKVPAEQVPKTTGNYEGTIKWTLRETIE